MKKHQNTSEWQNRSSETITNKHFSGIVFGSIAFCFHSAGETTYNLDTAGGLRLEVQKYYELIDALR